MKYMFLIYDDEKAWESIGEDQQQKIYAEYRQFGQQMTADGKFVAGSQLAPTTAATTVEVRDGERLVTDGPYAETREQLGGYYLLEANDLDEAIAMAARIPSARLGKIEIRPLV